MKKTKFFATVVICVFLTSLLFYIFKFYPSGNHSVTVNENTYQDNLKENEEISLSNLLYNHQQSHINKWYNSNKIYNATRLVMFIQNALEESNTFNKETKYISKEEFASKLTDSVIMRTRVATCMSISNNENTLVCGITNQLNGIVGCVAAMASLSQQSKLPEYGGAEIRAMLELEMCTAGSQGMMECTEHSPMSNIFNQTIFNSFVNDRKNWDNLVNIPTLSGGTLQWDEKSVKEVYPPSWKLSSTPPIKIVTDVPFFNGSLNMEIYKKDLLEIRKQQMNDFKGTFVMSKEEYLLMDCVRNVWIDSLKNWSKNKTSDNYRNIWEILYYSNNNNRQQRQRISVNQQYKMIIDILRNNCGSATNRTIDPYIHYYGYPGEFTTLEDKARNFVHLLTPESLDALRGTHFDDEQLLESRRSISKKVMNIGPMFSKWHPIQPYEIQFYLEVLQHLKPLNYIEEQVQSIFNRLYENHDHVVLSTNLGLVSWFFGVTIAKQKDLNLLQKIEIENEKILSSAKTKFIGNLSHEARNNLNCLIGAIHLLRSYQKVDNNVNNCKDITNNDNKININGNNCCCKHCIITNPSINELIQDISDNANLLLKIFTRSLQMSTLELGDIKLNIQPFNLLSLFESMISVYSPLANQKGVSLHSFFNFTKVPIYLLGDHVRISQIFMNIISNAIKYTNKNGCVTVTCNLADDSEIKEIIDIHNRDNKENKNTNNTKKESKEDKEEILFNSEDYHFVKIECKDTGKGISEKGLNELFTPFHTLDDKTQQKSTTTTNTQTTFDRYFSQSEQLKDNNVSVLLLQNRHGLGLSICKILIERMNGIISVKSKVNEGTTMTVIIPLKKVDNSKNKNNKDNAMDDSVNNIETDDGNATPITLEEQRFSKLKKLSLKITKTKYLLNIILMNIDKYFEDCISSYFNSFAELINYQLTTSNDPDEMESLITTVNKIQDNNVKHVIICSEEQFYNIQYKLKLLLNNKEINYQIVPTTLRASPRKEKCFYLTKPIKLLDILEFLFEQLREFLPKEQHLYKTKKKKGDIIMNNDNTNVLLKNTDLLSLLNNNNNEIDSNNLNINNSENDIKIKGNDNKHIILSQSTITPQISDNNSNSPKDKLVALVVDDVATNVKILKKLLEIIGFTEIDTASNGLECFEKFKQKKYSIILLDCLMPVLNGIQSCEMIRNYEKDCNLERTTIIAITANVFESKESLIEKGFTSVLYKPITLSTLKQEIKLYIDIENLK
ncbi:hypothetical protein ABK040_013309 [Willaertia magna]